MPDPTGANLTDAEVKRIEFADPHFQLFKLADRLQELRKDQETGETHGSMSLSLTADHTLVAPGAAAGSAETAITSKNIFVTTDGSEQDLTLCSPTKFTGKLTIWKIAGAGNLIVKHTQNPVTMNGDQVARMVVVSNGTNWWGETAEEVAVDLT